MSAETGRPGGKSLLDILVGIEAGVIGGLVMLVWFALMSPVIGEPWWLIPNMLASIYLGDRNVLSGPGAATWFGAAFYLFSAGAVGAINGILTPGGRLFGLLMAALWYLFCYFIVWKRIAPALFVQAPQPLIAAGYFLYGSTLGWHRQLLERARR